MLMVLTGIWIVIAVLAIGVWIYGILTSYREDDTVHLGPGEETEIDRQIQTEKRMKTIERWRMPLSLSTVIGGVLVLGLYIYQGLMQPGLTPLK